MPSDPYRDWEFARKTLRTILREWNSLLSPLEFKAVLFVYDRTVGWGKQWDLITRKQTTNGVYSPSGECWASPISSNPTRASTALLSLVKRGFVLRRQAGVKRWEYSLNVEMKIPKRMSNSDEKVVRYRKNYRDGSVTKSGTVSYPTYIEEDRVKKKTELRGSSTLADSSAENTEKGEAKFVVEKVILASRKRREVKKKSGTFERRANGEQSGFVPYRTALGLTWIDFYKQYFPSTGASSIDSITLKIFHCYAKNWTHLRQHGEFLEFLEWIFQNWSMLKSGPFSWMADFPLTPSVKLIVSNKLKQYFEEAYRKKEWWDRWRAMDEFERRVEQLVTMRGMDRDKAVSVATKETGFSDQLSALKEERRKLELTALRVKQAYRQEREALRKQQQAVTQPSRISDVEGDFGKWEENES